MALNMQKLVHNTIEVEMHSQDYLYSKIWWAGMILMLVGELGNFAAYGFAPAVLVAPLGTVAIISNIAIAPCFLGETMRTQDYIGVVFSVIGTFVILIVSTSTTEPTMSPEKIIAAVTKPGFIAYFCATLIILAFLQHFSLKPEGKRYILINLLLASIIGGYTVLAIKALSSLIKLNFYATFTYKITYLIILVTAVTGVLQIKYLNRSLSQFNSTTVIPTNFVLFTTCSIIGSSVLYDDLGRTSQFALLGVLFMFLGVFIITRKSDLISPSVTNSRLQQYESWNSENEHLWNPPTTENGITSPILIEDERSRLLVPSGSRTSYSTSPVRISGVNNSTSPTHRFQSAAGSFRKISSVLEAVGTHKIRKIEFDCISEISRSPRNN